jgi:hypothetical protein
MSLKPVYCNVSVDIPPNVLSYWNPYIEWARSVIVTEDADNVILELHWHADTWQLGCGFLGMHNSDTMELHLCGHKGPSKATILHEIAHLLAPVESGHGRDWAETLLRINERWLPRRRALRANRAHAYSYRSFASVWRRHSGESLPFRGFPRHTDRSSRDRARFRHRFQRRAALKALRTNGGWQDFFSAAAQPQAGMSPRD